MAPMDYRYCDSRLPSRTKFFNFRSGAWLYSVNLRYSLLSTVIRASGSSTHSMSRAAPRMPSFSLFRSNRLRMSFHVDLLTPNALYRSSMLNSEQRTLAGASAPVGCELSGVYGRKVRITVGNQETPFLRKCFGFQNDLVSVESLS